MKLWFYALPLVFLGWACADEVQPDRDLETPDAVASDGDGTGPGDDLQSGPSDTADTTDTPDLNEPDLSQPDVDVPDLDAPDLDAPDLTEPDLTEPDDPNWRDDFEWPWEEGEVSVAPDAAWRDTLAYPNDAFMVHADMALSYVTPTWTKWTILTQKPTQIFYQDANIRPFHYDFASQFLPPFLGLSPTDFDAKTLLGAGREAFLGVVLYAPPIAQRREIGLQLVSQDPIDRRVAVTLLDAVRDSLEGADEAALFYFPTPEQRAHAERDRAFFAREGYPVSSVERWVRDDTCYAPGWAQGRLVHAPSDGLWDAWRRGELGPEDIVLTDEVPSEVPVVAGIISFAPATPASHVALLAESSRIPFAYVASEASQAQLRGLVGERIVMRARSDGGSVADACQVRVEKLGALSPEMEAALLALENPLELEIARDPAADTGPWVKSTTELRRQDKGSFGGKSANFGVLSQAIPGASPSPALGFSFRLFDRVMAKTIAGGQRLDEAIEARLQGHVWPPEDPGRLAHDLAWVRTQVRSVSFSEEEKTEILNALAGFDPLRKLRFRSSANVEDGDHFTGAGLHSSHSGCLADDLEGWTGASLCDSSKSGPRGVFRALLRVYSSLWNENAFMTRLQYGVALEDVGMGVLVHENSPDPLEAANGVAVFERRSRFSSEVKLVTQVGAESVTNAEPGNEPEVREADIMNFGGEPLFTWRDIQGSSRLPVGALVLEDAALYESLAMLILEVAEVWDLHGADFGETAGAPLRLDLEYKKVRQADGPDRLEIKQVRALPLRDHQSQTAGFLAPSAAPQSWCVFQGEGTLPFAAQRLKLEMQAQARALWLDPEEMTVGPIDTLDLTMAEAQWSGSPENLPSATPQRPVADPMAFEYTWGVAFQDDQGSLGRKMRLNTVFPARLSASMTPILFFDELRLELEAFGEVSLLEVDLGRSAGGEAWVSHSDDRVQLVPCPEPREEGQGVGAAPKVVRVGEGRAGGLHAEMAFWHPERRPGVTGGYTAPLERWDRTEIRGVTSTPLIFESHWSQVYVPSHHNFTELFLFEPAMEPGISQSQLDELEALDIQYLLVYSAMEPSRDLIVAIDAAGSRRALMGDLEDMGH